MLYDNSPMSALPVKITDLKGEWDPDKVFNKRQGIGYIIQATVLGKSKHQINDISQSKFQYICIHISIEKAMRRKFDSKGDEIEPDFGSTKKVNTGYLMSSYKSVSKEGEDVIAPSKMKSLLHVKVLEELLENKLQTYNHASYVAAIWCSNKELEGIELPAQSKVRLRTIGDGCFLESIVRLDDDTTTKKSYTSHEPVGGSWTEKVLGTKTDKQSDAHLTKESEGVDDDEWDD